MTAEQMRAYIREQLATIDREEAEARARLQALAGGRQAYQDMLNELEKEAT